MEGEFSQPVTDGSGTNRDGRKRAIALLEEAGFELRAGVMTSKATGQPFTFEMICVSHEQERLMLAYSRFLAQIGVTAQVVDQLGAVSEAKHDFRLRYDASELGLLAFARQ